MDLLLQSLKKEFDNDSSEYVYEEIIPYIEDDVDEYYSGDEDV